MEEPEGDFDVPMSDLPTQLEDIIGDLIEQEDDLTEDVEDVSSSWMDNLDKGAGWDAADGPISNMSAKGVTSNQMPNDSEIGGRSGEGRSGKSHGQFVEEEAHGKGGRQTPTRLTNDPYEKGQVKDVSKDPVGGSTGGGKMGGLDQEGLYGAPPPEIKAELDRLKGKQADLRQQAQRLNHTLRRYNLPTGELEKTIAIMNKIERELGSGNYQGIQAARAAVKVQMKKMSVSIDEHIKLNKEKEVKIPKALREEIENAAREKDPPGYQELNDAYFRNLVKSQ